MRDDEDNIRQYLPVLRRIIILVAVLTAIPVVMWTITAFVRNHIGPPRAPDLRPMAIAPASPATTVTVAAASPDQAPAPSAGTAQAAAPKASAYADTKDGGGVFPPPPDTSPTGATPELDKTASVAPLSAPPNDAAPPAPPAASGSPDDANASPADGATPDQSSGSNGTQVAGRPPDSVSQAPSAAAAGADGLPPGEPISGAVPLPRKRPTSFAMAGNVPLPAPRPEAAGPGAAEASPTVADWLKKVFHSPTAPAPSSDGSGDTANE